MLKGVQVEKRAEESSLRWLETHWLGQRGKVSEEDRDEDTSDTRRRLPQQGTC